MMKVIRDLSRIRLHNTIVTLGKFDGFHIGHQKLLETANRLKKEDMKTVIFTFDVNPAAFLHPDSMESRLIQAHAERTEQSYPDLADYVIVFPFNKQTMALEPEQFVKEFLVDALDVRVIVAGYDFRFGKNRAGNVETLKSLGARYGFQVEVVKKVTVSLPDYEEPQEVSSTLIREQITRGHMEEVTLMLGQPFCITGVVEHGKHLGNTLGFPTINLNVPEDKIMPPNGVYATRIRIFCPEEAGKTEPEGDRNRESGFFGTKEYCGITNVGCRPTFDDGEHRTVETYLFDFDQDVYGFTAAVRFCHFLRPERKFESAEELIAAISHDKQSAARYFETQGISSDSDQPVAAEL